MYDEVFTRLGVNGVTIKINNRKVLSGIAEVIGAKDKLIDFTVALDKLDKIGADGVRKEMLEKGIAESAIDKLQPLFDLTGNFQEKLDVLKQLLQESQEGMQGIEELSFVSNHIEKIGLQTAHLDLEVTLARGLNYYTGCIFEVAAPEGVKMGSIGGGGRYDDLTGIFGLNNVSGVGISFGLDRIYLVMEELNVFPDTISPTVKVMFLNLGEKETAYIMPILSELRKKGVRADLYPDQTKIGKQFQYADKKGAEYAVLAGTSEMGNNKFTIKNLRSGEQKEVTAEELIKKLM